jgi:hypothetical protein
MEPIRYSRVGGYLHGDTRKLAQKLPSSVKRFYGVGAVARGGVYGAAGRGVCGGRAARHATPALARPSFPASSPAPRPALHTHPTPTPSPADGARV